MQQDRVIKSWIRGAKGGLGIIEQLNLGVGHDGFSKSKLMDNVLSPCAQYQSC